MQPTERRRFTLKKSLRKFLLLLLAMVFIGSAAKMIQQNKDYREGSQLYTEALEIADLPQIDLSQIEPGQGI